MVYFFINLVLHLAISCALVVFLLRFAKANRDRTNKRGFTFLLPVLFAIIFLFHGITNTFPKLADSVFIVNETHHQYMPRGTVESIGLFNNTFIINDTKYYYNPFAFKPKNGDILQVNSTPYSRYITKLTPVSVETPQNEEK